MANPTTVVPIFFPYAVGEGLEALEGCDGSLITHEGHTIVHLWSIGEHQLVGGHTVRLWRLREVVPQLFLHERHVRMQEVPACVEDVDEHSPCSFGIVSTATDFVEMGL
jgi:hypothetical protein